MSNGPHLPLRHLSVRVPWHDDAWRGTVCKDPAANASCMILDLIRQKRDDAAEAAVAGRHLADLQENQFPACVSEHSTFMTARPFERYVVQPYSRFSDEHKHILPTRFRHPPFATLCIPFRWMSRDARQWAWTLAEEYNLDVDPEREPTEPDWMKNWVQHHENQKALLDGFFASLHPDHSFCFFYAKQTPLAEDDRRVIIGVGRVKQVGTAQEYEYDTPNPTRRAYIWERAVEHSIRPDDFSEGFLMPYHEILAKAELDPSIDPAEYVAFAPEDRRIEFSYGAEHVTHDGAIAALLACKRSLEKCRTLVDAPCDQALTWIDACLAELWTLRGPYPGLGAALHAFGVAHGNFMAYEISAKLGENEDPWPQVDAAFQDPSTLSPLLAGNLTSVLCQTWQNNKQHKPERLALLKLLARMEITADQAERFYVYEERSQAGIACTDSDLLANPYLLYEHDRLSQEPISVWTVDRGVLPPPALADKHPLPAPSAPEGATDARRIRALAVHVLEEAILQEGHTLLARDEVVRRVRDLPLDPDCPLNGDILDVVAADIAPAITTCKLQNASPAYQLERLTDFGNLIRQTVEKRLKGKRHQLDVNWRQLLDNKLGAFDPADEQEGYAREEKAAALEQLAESRISVLIGPAGTGKTTLLSVLCHEPSIQAGGVLLLAPTGKARVRLQQSTGLEAKTLAQFLLHLKRYDPLSGVYHRSEHSKESGYQTVIVDETSMLTEDQLGALLDALQSCQRLILVGDPRQLPPIGAGRPFLDIVKRIAPDNIEAHFPRVAAGYAELTIRRRFKAKSRQDDMDLEDVQLAEWFSGRPLDPGEDEIISRILAQDNVGRVRFVHWKQSEELPQLILKVIAEELECIEDIDDEIGFAESLGATISSGYAYFNTSAADKVEAWQILSPVRGNSHGVRDLNRLVQRQFRKQMIEYAQECRNAPPWKKMWRIVEPRGPEEITYGDKVINLTNHHRNRVYPKEGALEYIANGEIGIITGQSKKKNDTRSWTPRSTQVVFASQPQHSYDFSAYDFSEEGMAPLELAYAITVHKAQGSEFGICFLVLPHPCRLLSRELLYTAFTRQKERIVVLHQADRGELKKYASAEYSATAQRWTNLFAPPAPVQINETFLDDHMIHRSGKGEPMRSKSEVIIADALAAKNIAYVYEQALTDPDGQTRYPDFTIEDADSGMTYYWEHCGLLTNEHYRRRWERKQAWYRDQGILPEHEGGGENGTLIVTEDRPNGGINSQEIKSLIDRVFG